jgi:hypothetical protein
LSTLGSVKGALAFRARAIAAVDEGYAVHIDGGSGGPRIRLFEPSGDAFDGDIVIPAGLTIQPAFTLGGSLPSAPGTLARTFRYGDGRAGWLEVTCGGE